MKSVGEAMGIGTEGYCNRDTLPRDVISYKRRLTMPTMPALCDSNPIFDETSKTIGFADLVTFCEN